MNVNANLNIIHPYFGRSVGRSVMNFIVIVDDNDDDDAVAF